MGQTIRSLYRYILTLSSVVFFTTKSLCCDLDFKCDENRASHIVNYMASLCVMLLFSLFQENLASPLKE